MDSTVDYARWFLVLELLGQIKSGKRDGTIPIVDSSGKQVGRHVHLSVRHLNDDALIETFVRWRNQNVAGYLDQRPVTFEGTRRWLVDAVTNPARLTSLMYFGDKLIGRTGTLDLRIGDAMSDGLVRGERGGGIDFVHHAQVAGLVWVFRFFGIAQMRSKVLLDNDVALDSCRRLGYDMTPFRIADLYKKASPEGTVLEESGGPHQHIPELQLGYFALRREAFLATVREMPWVAELERAIDQTAIPRELL